MNPQPNIAFDENHPTNQPILCWLLITTANCQSRLMLMFDSFVQLKLNYIFDCSNDETIQHIGLQCSGTAQASTKLRPPRCRSRSRITIQVQVQVQDYNPKHRRAQSWDSQLGNTNNQGAGPDKCLMLSCNWWLQQWWKQSNNYNPQQRSAQHNSAQSWDHQGAVAGRDKCLMLSCLATDDCNNVENNLTI